MKKTFALMPLALMMLLTPFAAQAQRPDDADRGASAVFRIENIFRLGNEPDDENADVPRQDAALAPVSQNAESASDGTATNADPIVQNTAPAGTEAAAAQPTSGSAANAAAAAIAAPALNVTPSTLNQNSDDPYAPRWPLSPEESQLLLELAMVLGIIGFLCIEQRTALGTYQWFAGLFAAPSQESPQVLRGSEQ